jgi:hypothetical protein
VSHIGYQAGLARRDDLLREAADRRRARELNSSEAASRWTAADRTPISRRLRRALSITRPASRGPHLIRARTEKAGSKQ